MRKRHLIISLIGLVFLISLYFIFKEEEVVKALSLMQTIFAYITLMIAIVLFDRYQAGNKLNDKTIDVVVGYIEFLKKTTIIGEIHNYNNKKRQKEGFLIIGFKSNQSESSLNVENYDERKLFVDFISFMSFYNNLNRFVESPWMPKEIIEASEFLKLKDKNTVYNPATLKQECIILTFTITDDSKGLLVLEDAETLNKFYSNISNLTKVINKWIKNQASDINFYI